MLLKIYNSLLRYFGSQKWWSAAGGFKPREWEICIGAILTQNTSWKNVEKALINMKKQGIISPEKTAAMRSACLERLVKPSGYYRQKADRLKKFAEFTLSFPSFNDFLRNATREQLLQVHGIGKETADSILLYACNRPVFVVDAYTRRIFSRLGIIDENAKYDEIKSFAEMNVMKDLHICKEYHALLVALGKNMCTKNKPKCHECPVHDYCRHGEKALGRKRLHLAAEARWLCRV